MNLTEEQKSTLLETAWHSIETGLRTNAPPDIDSTRFTETLNNPGASFVTLEKNGQLRGCIGSLEPYRVLVKDIAHNAFSAAFNDPRFPPLQAHELPDLTLEISVLTPPSDLQFTDELDMLQQLTPHKDGIVLIDGPHRATFLPQVWEQLPSPEDFISHLKNKAGLPADYWSDHIRVQRYGVEKFG